ncbi:MAG: GGDEF domain-containing protein [Anaerolineaceae bacterium]|nr:GGDEF domain-containing protein [Anaerolineaceae bacterium]
MASAEAKQYWKEKLFHIADQALYQAKEDSSKFIVFLEPEFNQSDAQQ